jgi:16S rRNA A1518/A1519 N6-dimethyltransferase RsmA/KsgA/DIM1 with predicted DNA glycosylase/AP lyase activity
MEIKLDQHFLEDEDLLNNILDKSEIKNSDIIFEIGPGKGDLTKQILKRNPAKLICIEKDEKLKEFLNWETENSSLDYIVGDGLEEIDKHLFSKLIANIPYSITEPLYAKILDLKIQSCILLHGIDFYKNIVERETRWKYFVKAFYDIELLEEVEGFQFNPPTKVKSVFVKLKLKKEILESDLLIQNLWNKRKRTTANTIIFSYVDTYNMTKTESEYKMEELKINTEILEKNFENLSNEEFNSIINLI